MSFALSKIFWIFAQPGNALLAILVLGLLLTRPLPKLGRALVALSTLAFLAIAILPLGARLTGSLENRFPPPPALDRVDGVVVLGGALSPRLSRARGHPVLQEGAERMTTMVALSRRYPEAKLAFTGGSGALNDPEAREAPWAAILFEDLGIDPGRMVFEQESRNTYENAVYVKELVLPQAEERWLLVTSAIHMPRAVGCFRKAGWDLTPYPVDYRTSGREALFDFSLIEGLRLLTSATKEWIGLVAYWAMGRTSELFPGPAADGVFPTTRLPAAAPEADGPASTESRAVAPAGG